MGRGRPSKAPAASAKQPRTPIRCALGGRNGQARQLGTSRGSIYYRPRAVPDADLAVMRRIDELHLLYSVAGSRILRDLLRQEGMAVGRLHVASLMKRMGLEALYRRPDTSKPGAVSTPVVPTAGAGDAKVQADDDATDVGFHPCQRPQAVQTRMASCRSPACKEQRSVAFKDRIAPCGERFALY